MEETVKQLQTEIAALKQSLDDKTKGFDEAKNQLKESSQFIEDASILVSAIMKDPALKTQVQASISGQPATPSAPASTPTAENKDGWKFDPITGKPIGEQVTPQAPQSDPKIDALDGQKRLEIIQAVESKFKISEKERTAIRKNVGNWLSSYNMKVAEIPVDQLEAKLNDAYLHVGLETASKDAKTDIVDNYFEDPGRFPSMGSGNPDTAATVLTPTQKKWSSKLQVSEDKVAAGLKELTETGVITYKPTETNTVKPQTPSGTPTPPTASN